MADHVRSAKIWLERAEQSFNSQSDIKGELNLMLAEAEMKNLRKKKAQKGYGKFVTAGVAVIVAIILVGAAGFYLDRSHGDTKHPLPQVEKEVRQPAKPPAAPATPVPDPTGPIEITPAEIEGPAYVSPEPAAPVASEPAPAETPQQAVPVTEPAAPAPAPTEDTPVLTDRQIQAAVQDARHTLRSTANETR